MGGVSGRRRSGRGVPSARSSSRRTSSASVNRVAPVKLQVVAGGGQPGADLLRRAVRAVRHQPERVRLAVARPRVVPAAHGDLGAPLGAGQRRSRRAPARRRPPVAWPPSTPHRVPGVGRPGRSPGEAAPRRCPADQQRQRGGGERGQCVPSAVRDRSRRRRSRAASSSAGTRRRLRPAAAGTAPARPGRAGPAARAARRSRRPPPGRRAAGQVPLVGGPVGGGEGAQHVRAVVVRELAPGHPVTPISARTNRSERSA